MKKINNQHGSLSIIPMEQVYCKCTQHRQKISFRGALCVEILKICNVWKATRNFTKFFLVHRKQMGQHLFGWNWKQMYTANGIALHLNGCDDKHFIFLIILPCVEHFGIFKRCSSWRFYADLLDDCLIRDFNDIPKIHATIQSSLLTATKKNERNRRHENQIMVKCFPLRDGTHH